MSEYTRVRNDELAKLMLADADAERLKAEVLSVFEALQEQGAEVVRLQREVVAAKATTKYVRHCIEGDRFKDAMGMTADWYVDYSLGTAAYAYYVQAELDDAKEAEADG